VLCYVLLLLILMQNLYSYTLALNQKLYYTFIFVCAVLSYSSYADVIGLLYISHPYCPIFYLTTLIDCTGLLSFINSLIPITILDHLFLFTYNILISLSIHTVTEIPSNYVSNEDPCFMFEWSRFQAKRFHSCIS